MDPLARYHLFTRLITQLVATAEARGQFRFLISAVDAPGAPADGAPRLQLVLLNWDTSLQTNDPRAAAPSDCEDQRRPVAKVKFNEYGLCPSMEDEEYVSVHADGGA